MFGFSLDPSLFSDTVSGAWQKKLLDEFGGLSPLLQTLKQHGTASVELHSIPPKADPGPALACARALWENGLRLTVHGAVPGSVGAFSDTCPSLLPLLKEAREHQDRVIITLHAYITGDDADKAPAAEKTNRLLRVWEQESDELGFRLALEINRDKRNGDPSVTCDGVLAMLEGTKPEAVGICFDMGHYCSNLRSDGLPLGTPPGAAFLERVIHTHIHALGSGGTHFPLTEDAVLPLEDYIRALVRAGYPGLYNLELDFARWQDRSFWEAAIGSLDVLSASVAANRK